MQNSPHAGNGYKENVEELKYAEARTPKKPVINRSLYNLRCSMLEKKGQIRIPFAFDISFS